MNANSEPRLDPRRYVRPAGLRGLKYHPVTQVAMLGVVCFMGPGLFNAMTGLGAAGQVNSTTSANANATIYTTFAITALFAGPICNVLGFKPTLFLGSIGYAIHVSAYLTMKFQPNAGPFVIVSGALLGICSGLLWTAQGSLMLAYPTEDEKGRFIGIFWSIYNMGGIVGAAVSLGTNFQSKANSVEAGTYIAFLVLSLGGVITTLFMTNPRRIIRTDGTKLTVYKSRPNWKSEASGFFLTIKKDPYILLLFPMFLSSNWYYTWQFNDYNGALFNIRTRAMNNFIYWLSSIGSAYLLGRLLDGKNMRRRVRAFLGWGILFIMVWCIYIWAYVYQRQYTRESIPPEATKMDLYDPPYIGRAILYVFFALLGATWQIAIYWIIGAMSNDPNKLAYFTGLYQSIQSAGAAGVWRADAVKISFMNIFLSTWVLQILGLLFAFPMIYWYVTDQTDLEEKDPVAGSASFDAQNVVVKSLAEG